MVDDDLRARTQARFLPWGEGWERALVARPEYVRAALDLDAATADGPLDDRTRAFVRIALHGAVTHLDPPRLERAIADALESGASEDEVLEALMIACTVGVHGMNADVLAEVLAERGLPRASELTPEQARIKREYRESRGYWRDFLDPTLELAPRFLDAYLEFSAAPWRHGVLPPKTRELLYLAFDTAPTHLHLVGLRVHIHNALDHGATVDEIVEVMAMSAALGLETLEVGVPLLGRAMAERRASD